MAVRTQRIGDYDSADTAVSQNPGATSGYTGHTAQASGISDMPTLFGGQQNWANIDQSVQQQNQNLTPPQLAAQQEKLDQYANAIYEPDSTASKIFGGLALAGSVAGIGLLTGGVLAPALAGAVGGGAVGSVFGGIGAGAATGAAGSALTGQNIGKGALLGGVGGGLASAAAPLASGLSSATGLDPALSSGLVKAGTGAIGAEIGGGNPLQGAVTSGVGGAVGGELGGGPLGNLAGNVIGGFAGQQVAGQPRTSGAPIAAGQNNMIGGGSVNPQISSGAINPQTYGAANPFSGFGGSMGQAMAPGGGAPNPFSGTGSSLGGLFGAGLGIASNNQQSNLQQNAYTTAGNAANYNPFNFNGVGGVGASFNNGTGTLSAGGFNPSGFQGLTNTALGSAGQFAGGGLPQGVSAAGNNYMSALGGAQSAAGGGAGAGLGMFGQGANLVNGANGTWNGAYNTSLNAGQAALQQPLQQQYNALRNQQFETGQSGTSGGALQTQAFATGMGQAELQAQQNAVGQANAAQGISLGYGTNLMNSGLSNFGNFNSQGAGFAGQGLNAQMGLGSYSPQLSSLYANLANTGVSGLSGVQGMGTQLAQLGLQGMQIGGNNMNNAARTQGAIAQNPNYTNQNSGYSTALNSLFGNGGLMGGSSGGGGLIGGLGSAFSSLFGGGGSNPTNFGMQQTDQLSSNFNNSMGGALPGFDTSQLGQNLNIPDYSGFGGLNTDNMGDYGL